MFLQMNHLQIDNQLYESDNQKYDFPVIFIPKQNQELKEIYYNQRNYSIIEMDEFFMRNFYPNNSKFLYFDIKFHRDIKVSKKYLSYEIDFSINSFEVYLEDSFLYELLKTTMDFVKCSQTQLRNINDENHLNKDYFLKLVTDSKTDKIYQVSRDLDSLISPITVSILHISRIDAVVSLRTSYKIHLLSYKMPIAIEEFKINEFPYIILTFEQLFKLITTHYLSSLLFKTGWLLGSLDFIGSPTVFIQNLGDGIYNFFSMP